MAINLLVLYEITDKASRVTTRKAYKEFERWVKSAIELYKGTDIERIARGHLFRLKHQLAV